MEKVLKYKEREALNAKLVAQAVMERNERKERKPEQPSGYNELIWTAGVIAIIFLVLMAVGLISGHQRAVDADAKVQVNVQQAVTDLKGWTRDFPFTEVHMKTVVASSGHQYVTSPWGLTNPNENSRRSVPVYAEPGNTIVVKPGDSIGSYTICGYSGFGEQASSAASAVVYDSSTGETKTGVPCPTALFPTY